MIPNKNFFLTQTEAYLENCFVKWERNQQFQVYIWKC